MILQIGETIYFSSEVLHRTENSMALSPDYWKYQAIALLAEENGLT